MKAKRIITTMLAVLVSASVMLPCGVRAESIRKNIQANVHIPEEGLTIDENLIKNSGITFVDLPVTETQDEEQKEEKQPLKKRIKDYLLNFLKQIKSKLWRLLRNEKK